MSNSLFKQDDSKYIVCELIDIAGSPLGEAIVANEKEVFFVGAMDQIMDGSTYLGAIYPSVSSEEIQELIRKYTIKIGKYLGKYGYRGFFGVDYIVDLKGKLYFSEINPRTCGSTLERMYMHEMTKKAGVPSLAELELRAVNKNTFGKIKSKKIRNGNFSWGVLNVKTDKKLITLSDFAPDCQEAEAFKTQKTTILDHLGKNVIFFPNSRICRIVSVKPTRAEIEKELKEKEQLVRKATKRFK